MPLSISTRLNTLLLMLLVLMAGAIIAILATRAYGGPLDPSAPPASTMKSLEEVPGSWSRQLDATNGAPVSTQGVQKGCNSDRFKCVLPVPGLEHGAYVYDGVLDEETGLVWQRVASGPVTNLSYADFACLVTSAGVHSMGWRLPTISEITSVMDAATVAPPVGSPFIGVAGPNGFFWTTTIVPGFPTRLHTLAVGSGPGSTDVTVQGGAAWCVRGSGN